MSSLAATYITPEEYLERERAAETKSEYFRGAMFAMAGASLAHATIISNLVGELRSGLRKRCRVFSTDLRLAVQSTGLYTYPDVMAICGPPELVGDRKDIVTNPVLIIEVLSPSTKDYDRGEKFENYRTIPSLKEYATVAQDKKHVEIHTRQPDDSWLLREVKDDGILHLHSVELDLQLSNIYEGVELAA